VEFADNLSSFDRNLSVSLLLAALALLLVLASILAWGLKPLRDIGKNLKRIETGETDRLDTKLPHELKPLASSINTLLASERNRQTRYRNVMDDLAHSLKTPLSVLGNISTQSGHVQRARAGNRQALAPPLSPAQTVRRLGESLQKIYADTGNGKPVQFITNWATLWKTPASTVHQRLR